MEAKYFIDTRTTRADGASPLKVKIWQDRRNYSYVSLKIYLRPTQWDGEKVVAHVDVASINPRLRFYKIAIAKVLLEVDMSGEAIPLDEVVKRVKAAIGGNFADKTMSFTEYYREHIGRLMNRGTKRNRSETFAKLNTFANGKPVQFADITVRWLSDFDRFMSALSVNARSVHMRNVRAVLNDAIDEEVAPEMNPFRRFKIRQEPTRKRSLSIEQLRTLRDYPCTESQAQYRDIFMLIFYLRGINIGDLFRLKNIENGYIYYTRSKTRKQYAVKVEPEAIEIIERYRGRDYLLAAADRYQNYEDFTRRINRALQSIGAPEMKKLNSSKPGPAPIDARNGLFLGLTTYWARHTWATIAASLDVPKETIAVGLGHDIGNPVTSIYINFDQRKVDEANRKILDAIK